MFVRWEPVHGAPRDGASSLADAPLASDSRAFRQPSATRSESRHPNTHGTTSLESHRLSNVHSNSFKMKTFQNERDNFLRHEGPGQIVIRGTLLESVHTGEFAPERPACAKPFRMITFSNTAKQLLCNENVCKKGGGGGTCLRALL